MLHINELSYRIEGRPILEGATVGIPEGHKVGLVGRNGAGKTTLLRLITGEIAPDLGSLTLPKGARIGYVMQEAPGGEDSLIDWVLSTDKERARLLEEAETATDPQRIADIHTRLADIDAHSAPARAAQILAGLGFDEAAQRRPCRDFSGGWRMRVALGSVLFLEPELLLLDEPTNYLDLEGTLWLETHLRAYPHTVLMVSHDRDLLNRAVGAILHLDRGRLTLYAGGYDDFEAQRRAKLDLDLKLKKKQDEQRKHLEAFITRFKAKASKATQAQSRVKALAKMQPIAAEVEDQVVPFRLTSPAKALASPLIRLEGASVGYEPGRPILRGLDLRIDQDDRIALLGQNGNGKSTFAKLIAGRLAPLGGGFFGMSKVQVGFFAQHQLEDLVPDRTPYAYMVGLLPDGTEAQRRARLGTYGFSYDKADTKCANLSGGEKARLLLMLTAFAGPHLLILDEPTNHLDVDSREALIHALNDYEGAVILISHDRHLVEACADRLWIVRDGTVKSYDGDMESYRELLLSERGAGRARSSLSDRAAASAPTRQDVRRQAAERRAELAPLKKIMQGAEKRIEQITAEIARRDAALADQAIYAKDPARAQKLAMERGQLARDLASAEEDWLSATEAYERASQDA
jgi:ATP-binding cassette subfamily F protein 3